MNIRRNCKRLGEEPEQARWSSQEPSSEGKAKRIRPRNLRSN